MTTTVPELARVQIEVKSGGKPEVTVRELLRWFGAQKRGSGIVQRVRAALKDAELATVPDFQYEYIDGPIYFVNRRADNGQSDAGDSSTSPPQATMTTPDGATEPVASLARLSTGDRTSVRPCR